jgi:hypothetical protein
MALGGCSASDDRSRSKYLFRYDDPDPASLLAFLVEGFRLATETVTPSLWGPPIEIDPAYTTPIRNMLADVNATIDVIDKSLRSKATDMLAAVGVNAADGESIASELVSGWKYQQIAADMLVQGRTVPQSALFSPAARVIAAVCILLRGELGEIRDTPLYGEVANFLNAGIPRHQTGLKGRHMRAGANRWRNDVVAAVQRRRRDCISADDFMKLEVQHITGTVQGLLVLWREAPSVERFKGQGRGAALARSIDDQDCITYRIGKAHGQPLNLRRLYDCGR